MGDRKYTGPTSGRITVGGDGSVIKRETFTDQPLTADEMKSLEWFTSLSPNQQLREVRILKWNLAEVERSRSTWKRLASEEAERANRAEAALRRITPEGYRVPEGAAGILADADVAGWKSSRVWTPLGMDGADEGYRLSVAIRHGLWAYQVSWIVDSPKHRGRLARGGLATTPDHRAWHDAPSVTKIREVITGNPSTDPR